MGNDTILDLIPDLTMADVAPDIPTNPIQSDPKVNQKAAEPRLFTIEQIQHLFNVLHRRSIIHDRMTAHEQRTKILEDKVAELEKWRPLIEGHIEKREADVDAKF